MLRHSLRKTPQRLTQWSQTIGLLLAPFFVFGLAALSISVQVAASDGNGTGKTARPDRSWRLLSELSPEEMQRLDLSTDTPRDTTLPYMPAEPYPFTPPYTAEEIGYRIMEFPHMPRWNCVQIEDSGTLTPSGYLFINQIIVLVQYREPAGLMGQILTQPGEIFSRWLTQDIAPPENHGNQLLFSTYRTDQASTQKADMFGYSPTLRRVRRFPQPRRQDKFPNQPVAYDDFLGRDAWEFSWRIIGTDVLYETARFPTTRQSITLRSQDGTFNDVAAADLRLMGDTYPYYTEKGGVRTYVMEATAKQDWLPGYYAPRILYWVDQEYFYPLRIEAYGPEGELVLIEERIAKLMNPSLKEHGYHNLLALWWDPQQDFYSYGVHDAMELREWSQEDKSVFFSPDFMRRGWFPVPLKTQAGVSEPEEFFLRPHLYRDKFPTERTITLSPDLEARIQAQEKAGRLVFIGGQVDSQ